MARKFLISRIALAVALTGGVGLAIAPTASIAAEKEKKASFSKEYAAAAAEIDKTLTEKKADPAVKAASDKAAAAQTDAEKAAARAEVDAALGGIKAKLDAAGAVATAPLDKIKQGEMVRTLGVYMADPAMQHQGLVQMYESGQLQPETQGQVIYLAGVTSYQSADYAEAAKWLKMAQDAGYQDPQGMLPQLLADSYKRSGNSAAALEMTKKEIEAAKAAGTAPSETAIRSALQQAYDSKQLQPSAEYAAMLAQYYPSPEVWNISTSIVRQLASLPKQQNIDLMRLMYTTNALKTKGDYLEYLENADPRAYPGEALKIMDQGLAKGTLTSADLGGEKAATEARVKSDKASLPGQEADANKSGATVQTVQAAGDVFLSYDQPAKAETFFARALGMPGADTNTAALRLGIAQALQGKGAEAQTSLAKVTGNQAAVAKLWAAYAAGKK